MWSITSTKERRETLRKRSDRPDRNEWWLAVVLLVPNLILLGVFTYRPLADNIRLSFTNWNISSPTAEYIGFANYRVVDPPQHVTQCPTPLSSQQNSHRVAY